MIEGLPPISHERAAGVRRSPRAEPPAQPASAARVEQALDPFPSSPPAEVHQLLDTAARVIQELADKQVSLRFQWDESSSTVHVQVRDSAGRVLREIPATQGLDVLAGERSIGVAVDALG
jgi:uncharacterized FlaG/YvyC family protein